MKKIYSFLLAGIMLFVSSGQALEEKGQIGLAPQHPKGFFPVISSPSYKLGVKKGFFVKKTSHDCSKKDTSEQGVMQKGFFPVISSPSYKLRVRKGFFVKKTSHDCSKKNKSEQAVMQKGFFPVISSPSYKLRVRKGFFIRKTGYKNNGKYAKEQNVRKIEDSIQLPVQADIIENYWEEKDVGEYYYVAGGMDSKRISMQISFPNVKRIKKFVAKIDGCSDDVEVGHWKNEPENCVRVRINKIGKQGIFSFSAVVE